MACIVPAARNYTISRKDGAASQRNIPKGMLIAIMKILVHDLMRKGGVLAQKSVILSLEFIVIITTTGFIILTSLSVVKCGQVINYTFC